MVAKKSVTINYIYNLFYQLLAIIIPLVTTPYLSRVLGAENIGIYSFTLSITTYFILFGSLGIAMYGQREIAYFQNDKDKRTKIFFEMFFVRLVSITISIAIFCFGFCTFGDYSSYYKILLLEIIANSIDISWFFQGLEEFKKTVKRNIIVKLISVVCIFLLVKTSNDLYKYFFIYVLSTFLGNVTLWFYLPKYINKLSFKGLNLVKHIKPTIILFVPQIATQIYTVLDKTMIGIIIGDKAEVGYYEQAQKMIKLLMTLATSLGTVMLPRIAATYANGDLKKVKEYMNKSFGFIMMLAFPLMFGMISVAYKFVPIFYGSEFDKVAPLICVISPIIILIGLSNVTGTQYLLPTKQQNKYTISVVIGAIINFILNMLLIKKFASIGASIATVLAEFAVTFIQIYLIRKQIILRQVIKITYKYFIAAFIMFVISIVISMLVKNNIISIIVQLIFSAITYFTILIVMKDDLVFEGIKMIKNKK